MSDEQLRLFGPVEKPAPPAKVAPAPVTPEIAELAAALRRPGWAPVRLGGSTWSYPGWAGTVYASAYPERRLARHGLAAYARHPLLAAVGIDRTFYRPLPAADFARYAGQVHEDFRFLVKAHEDLTLPRFPDHPRYGDRRGLPNPRFLDPVYATGEVIAPYVEGLGAKAGALLLQFPPGLAPGPATTGSEAAGDPAARFAERLHRFLAALPTEATYAVELRDRQLLSADYAAALTDTGACHCLNIHPSMPSPAEQGHTVPLAEGPALIIRWLVRPGLSYRAASPRFAPFDRLREPDPKTRAALADLIARAAAAGTAALVAINNLAEGCGPLSAVELAREIVAAIPVP